MLYESPNQGPVLVRIPLHFLFYPDVCDHPNAWLALYHRWELGVADKTYFCATIVC